MNISAIIQDYLEKHIGKTFTSGEVRENLNLSAKDNTFYTKIHGLKKAGHLITNPDGSFTVQPSIVNVIKKSSQYPNQKPNPNPKPKPKQQKTKRNKNNGTSHQGASHQMEIALTPAAHFHTQHLEITRDAQPIDLSVTMAHIMRVDEQNKMYRNALEQIVVLLEQAGIIEKAE